MLYDFMFSTSHDILLLTISVCVAAFTIFLCWGMFYLVAMARNTFKIIKDVKNILQKVEETIDLLKSKIHESASYLLLLGEVLKKIMDVAHGLGERRREAKEEKETKENEDECDCEECKDDNSCEKKSKPQKIKVR
jgi:TRAP-type C4-dicarboxylate transport system permease small subunit